MLRRMTARIEFRQQRLVFSLFLLIAFMLQGYYLGGGPLNNAYMAFLSAIGAGPSAFLDGVLPLIACLVAGDALAMDKRTGKHVFTLTRTSRLSYARRKVLLSLSLTGLNVMVGLAVSLGLSCLLFPSGVPNLVGPFPPFLHDLLGTDPIGYVLLIASFVTLSAIAWSSLSLVVSLWTTNTYMVLGIPWVIYILFTVLLQMLGLAQFAPLILSGPFLELTAGAQMDLYLVPLVWIAFTVICVGIVFLSYAKGADVLD